MSTVTLVVIVWACGALATFRPVLRGWSDEASSPPDWIDAAFWLFIAGALVVVAWPLAVAFFALRRVVGEKNPVEFVRVVGGESREQRLTRREQEVRDREQEVARLEAQLSVGRHS